MKIAGRRADGAMYLSIGVGHAVILLGSRVSSPVDESVAEAMGPWTWTPDDNTFEARKLTERALDRARVATLDYFKLGGPPPWLAKKKGDGDTVGEETPKKDGLFVKKEEAVALDESNDSKEKKPVSEIAQTAQSGEAAAPAPKEEVMNLPPNPFFPADERKKKRGALAEKIASKVKSQKKVGDMLTDEDISDDDLYAMAKALGITTEEIPRAVTLVDNATKFQRLLASTREAKHLKGDGGEHPFQYCIDNVVPAMEREGKGPDDPNAFCAYWKAEHGD